MSRRIAHALAALLTAAPNLALAQSTPNWSYGQVVTAGQMNAAFGAKQDLLNFSPLNLAGGTMRGKLNTAAATNNGAGFSILPGVAPTAASNGDMWITPAGLFAQINGQAAQFLTSASLGTIASQNANAVAITGGSINGTTIGGTTPAAGFFTALTLSTPLALSGGGLGTTSLTGALDTAFGSAQGSIVYRDSNANGGWKALGPGTTGYVLQTGGTGANPSWVAQSGSGSSTAAGTPQGRMTLTSGTPVLTNAVSGATSVIYTPYTGTLVPLWNGTAFVMTACPEYTQALSDTTYSPSAAAAGQLYDYEAWLSGGTCRVTRGPAWSAGTGGSNTVRGTGTGGAALTRVNGILVNAAAVTNGPAAGYGTYVGTISTDAGGATVTFNPSTAASPAVGATVGLWNAYNRVPVAGLVRDTTTSWAYAGSAWRAANGANPRITFVTGLAEDAWTIDNITQTGGPAAGSAYGGVGVDSVSAAAGPTGTAGSAGGNSSITYLSAPSKAVINAPLGSHFASAIEAVAGGSAATYYGTSGTNVSGLAWQGRY